MSFDQLQAKYESVLRLIHEQQVWLEDVRLEEGKLSIRAIAPSEAARDAVLEQARRINPQLDDIVLELSVSAAKAEPGVAYGAVTTDITGESHPQAAAVGSGAAVRFYTVQPGDTLAGIAGRFYGNPSLYRRILDANRDKVDEQGVLRPGQDLIIPLE